MWPAEVDDDAAREAAAPRLLHLSERACHEGYCRACEAEQAQDEAQQDA